MTLTGAELQTLLIGLPRRYGDDPVLFSANAPARPAAPQVRG